MFMTILGHNLDINTRLVHFLMTFTILSKHSRTIQKLLREQMQQQIEELGFDPFGDGDQDEYERRVMDLDWKTLNIQKLYVM